MADNPSPGKETVYIDVDDDITSIIDKVENAKVKIVALVLPKRAAVLQSVVNMRLLKKAADNAKKTPVLVTTEAALLPLAGVAGLRVASSLDAAPEVPAAPETPKAQTAAAAQERPDGTRSIKFKSDGEEEELPTKIDYGKSVGELAAVHGDEPPETIELGDETDPVEAAAKSTEKLPKSPKIPKDKRIKVPNFDRFRLMLGLGVIGLAALIIFIIFALFILPKAVISIQTTSTPVSTSMVLTTSGSAKSLDENKGIIPAVLKTSDQTSSSQVNATGQVNNGQKASGTVTLIAEPCPSTPPTVDGGTGLSSNGLAFITNKSVQLTTVYYDSSANQTACKADVGVTAQVGGAKYNLASGQTFAVSGYSGVTGTNSNAFTGGTDNIQTVVAQSDVDNAAATLKNTSSQNYAKNFEDSLAKQGFYVLTSTMNIGTPQTTANPAVGQPGSTTTVSIKITYSVLCIKKDDLVKALTDSLNKQIDPASQKVEATDVINGASISVAGQASPTDVTLNITESAPAVPILNTASIKKQAEGQKSGDIIAAISSTPGVKNVNVKLSPFWVSKVPKNPSKITVNLQHLSGSNGQ